MDRPRKLLVSLALASALHVCAEANAQSFTTYLESSASDEKPRSNLGLSLHGDRLQVRAGVALRGISNPDDPDHYGPGESTEVVPNVRSAFSVAKNLALETRVSLPEWNAGTDATLDTRLRYRKSLHSFFNELDGSIWRSPEGFTRQILRLGFRQLVGDAFAGTPLTITGAAIFEATQDAAALAGDSHKVGVETRVTGLMPWLAASDHSFSFKVEKIVGTRPESASTLAYDQSWSLSPLTNMGLSLKLLRRTYSPVDYEPSIDFSWRARL